MRRADVIAGIALLGIGLLVLFGIIPREADGDTWSGVSPLFFPTLIAAAFCLACVGLLLQAWLRPGGYEGLPSPVALSRIGFFALSFIIVLGGVGLIHVAGFIWGGPVLVAGLMLFMGERRAHRIVVMSCVPVAVIYFFVTKLLSAPLP